VFVFLFLFLFGKYPPISDGRIWLLDLTTWLSQHNNPRTINTFSQSAGASLSLSPSRQPGVISWLPRISFKVIKFNGLHWRLEYLPHECNYPNGYAAKTTNQQLSHIAPPTRPAFSHLSPHPPCDTRSGCPPESNPFPIFHPVRGLDADVNDRQ